MTYNPSASGSGGTGSGPTTAIPDVLLTTPTANQYLQYSASSAKWVNHTLIPADVSGLTDFVNNLIASSGNGTTNSAPGIPTSFVASSSSSTSITLTWAAPTSAGSSAVTGYTVNYTGGTAHTVSASTLTYTYTGLTAGTAYQFTVAATNAVGTGSTATTSYTISTSSGGTGVPTAPTNVQATVSGTTATLTWAAPSSAGGSAITGYIAARDGVDSNGSGVYTSPTLSASTLSLVFNNLVAGSVYNLTVKATNSAGIGPAGTATVGGTTTGGGGSSSSSPSGIAMPTADVGSWQYSYGNDFTVNAALGQFANVYGTNWAGYNGSRTTNNGSGTYRPDLTLSVANSCLDIYLHYEQGLFCSASPFPQPPSGVNGGSQEYQYMRTSVCFKALSDIPGWKTAWMLWPSSYAWTDGEIDFPEGGLDSTIGGNQHGLGSNDATNVMSASSNAKYSDGWHVATTEWSSGRVSFILDGTTIGTSTQQIATTPHHWNLQTEPNLGQTPSQSVSGHIQIDWVAVWSQ